MSLNTIVTTDNGPEASVILLQLMGKEKRGQNCCK